jgi:hypothetical protein
VAQERREPVEQGLVVGIAYSEATRDGGDYHVEVGDRPQSDEMSPVRKRASDGSSHVKREAGFPHSTGAGQRDEPQIISAQ